MPLSFSPRFRFLRQADEDYDDDMDTAIRAGRTFNIAGYESWQYEDDSGACVRSTRILLV